MCTAFPFLLCKEVVSLPRTCDLQIVRSSRKQHRQGNTKLTRVRPRRQGEPYNLWGYCRVKEGGKVSANSAVGPINESCAFSSIV